MGLKIVDKIRNFASNNTHAMDRAVNRLAVDIERLAKEKVPVDKGQLRAAGKHTKKGFMKYVVSFDKEYAGYQEFGQRADGSHVVRRYTTPGTGSHYLRDAGRTVSPRVVQYFKEEARTVRA